MKPRFLIANKFLPYLVNDQDLSNRIRKDGLGILLRLS